MFLDEAEKIIYIGKANNIKKRVSSYFLNKNLGPKTAQLVSKIKSIRNVSVDSEIEAFLLEAYLIKKYNPIYNVRLTDGKNYPYVYIDNKSKFSKVLVVRRPENLKNIFGPFPNSGDLRYVLKLVRRIFPYQSVVNHPKKRCLYYHLGLCPCPPLLSENELKAYQRNIKHLIKFMKGDTKGVVKDLEKERNSKSKTEDFEDALEIQNKINKIVNITTSFIRPFDYDLNPNLREDSSRLATLELRQLLLENGVKTEKLERIECYDISNIAGQYSVGSMVVFKDGEKDSSSYRRFKIKNPPKVVPNDFAMMEEVLERRIKRNDWQSPDLIIVDGGKGQVSVVRKVLQKNNSKVPLIGIAKKEETIITSDFKEIKLRKGSLAFKLVTGMRNEAHRFAVTYHKKIRSKMVFEK